MPADRSPDRRNNRGVSSHSSPDESPGAGKQGWAAHQRGDSRPRSPSDPARRRQQRHRSIADALAAAQEAGLDLVEISPNAAPPIVKILDYGKYKYQEQKKAAEARKKQKVVEVKELKYRPMIDDHDYMVKMRAMERFFEEGDKVKITLRFRGREMAHQELGTKLLNRVKDDTAKMAKVEMEPRFEGRQMIMILVPR